MPKIPQPMLNSPLSRGSQIVKQGVYTLLVHFPLILWKWRLLPPTFPFFVCEVVSLMSKNVEFVLSDFAIRIFRIRYGWTSGCCAGCGRRIRKGARIVRSTAGRNGHKARIFIENAGGASIFEDKKKGNEKMSEKQQIDLIAKELLELFPKPNRR